FRHLNNNWEELPTSYVKEQGGYQYYTAKTAGFSLFAIGTKKVEAATSETTSEPTVEPTTLGTTKEKTNVMPFVLVLVALILIAGIVYFVLNKKNH
ncbi:MAG: PGF-pre-PGF domain-containing protein, partial [Nanoarchaeota archaeon]